MRLTGAFSFADIIIMDSIKKENLPKHIVIIPDGNRRWAKKKGLRPWLGHKEGVKTFEEILHLVDKLDIYCFSFWGASKDNILKRNKAEVAILLELFRIHFSRLLKNKRIYEKGIRVSIFGEWEKHLSARIKKPMLELMEKTEKFDKFFLNFFIMYDGREEMAEAIKKIAKQSKEKPGFKITQKLIKENLYTRDLPAVDFLIRTGVEGDPHNSAGFMMWDTSYSQLYFTETTWPDFKKDKLIEVLKDYEKRERRLGS
jgi:undecaprenyl diphosphate synthase